jgi:hypothetical protein
MLHHYYRPHNFTGLVFAEEEGIEEESVERGVQD